MANTLTNLIPSLYAGLHTVSRELVGFIPAVARNSTAERAAVGQTITFPIAPSATTSDVTPAMTVPEPTDKTVGSDTITITKSKQTSFGFIGEEQLGLSHGATVNEVQAQLFAEGLRVLVNEMEADISGDIYVNASRATGTAGTTPFASGVADSANIRKILNDNGAPLTDRQIVINSTSAAVLGANTQLTKVNEAGDDSLLRQGIFNELHNLSFRETGQGDSHTASGATGYLVNDAAATVGQTTIPIDTGSGTIIAGDVFVIAGDTNQYVVTGGNGTTSIEIATPGLRVAPADNAAITLRADYLGDVAFQRQAFQFATRAPALPTEGDAAADRMMLVDPRSGMAFEVSIYVGYRKVRYEVAAAWGWKAIDPQHIALLLG